MVNSRVTIPTQFCPTLKPKFSTWRKTAFFTISPAELPRYPVSHMAPTEREKHPSLFLNTYSGAGTETRSGCRRLAGKRLHLPRDPIHRNGATEGGSQQSSGLWHRQQTAQHAEVSSWLACKLPGLTGNHGETSGESLKGQTGVLKEKSNIQRQGGTVSRRSGESRKASAVRSRGPTAATTQCSASGFLHSQAAAFSTEPAVGH